MSVIYERVSQLAVVSALFFASSALWADSRTQPDLKALKDSEFQCRHELDVALSHCRQASNVGLLQEEVRLQHAVIERLRSALEKERRGLEAAELKRNKALSLLETERDNLREMATKLAASETNCEFQTRAPKVRTTRPDSKPPPAKPAPPISLVQVGEGRYEVPRFTPDGTHLGVRNSRIQTFEISAGAISSDAFQMVCEGAGRNCPRESTDGVVSGVSYEQAREFVETYALEMGRCFELPMYMQAYAAGDRADAAPYEFTNKSLTEGTLKGHVMLASNSLEDYVFVAPDEIRSDATFRIVSCRN